MLQTLTLPQVSQLARILSGRLSQEEFKTVLFNIGTEYDSIRGSTYPAKVREGVDHARRMGHVQELLQACVNANHAIKGDIEQLSFIAGDYTPTTEHVVDDILDELEFSVDDKKEERRKKVLEALQEPGSQGIKEALFFLVKYA